MIQVHVEGEQLSVEKMGSFWFLAGKFRELRIVSLRVGHSQCWIQLPLLKLERLVGREIRMLSKSDSKRASLQKGCYEILRIQAKNQSHRWLGRASLCMGKRIP